MQPYPNPNYFMQYQQPQYQQSNPYMQRMEQLQQFQQTLQPQNQSPALNMLSALGKYVESMDMVKATDIPMDGNMYFFPKADGTEIYGKAWMQDGRTRILTFKPVLEDEPNNLPSEGKNVQIALSDETTEVFMKQFEELKERLDGIEQTMNKSMTKTTKSMTKKEVAEDE